MQIERRISATFKDLPGGQLLGPTFDYTHRLLDPDLEGEGEIEAPLQVAAEREAVPRVTDLLGTEGLIEPDGVAADSEIGDLTREPLAFPADRALRLQALSRGDEGFPAGARLFDPARLCPLASFCRRNPHGRGRGRARCP
jgi:alpha-D-ribose 1-methylphosphonate 5-triphosphate synthase subunit PhnI